MSSTPVLFEESELEGFDAEDITLDELTSLISNQTSRELFGGSIILSPSKHVSSPARISLSELNSIGTEREPHSDSIPNLDIASKDNNIDIDLDVEAFAAKSKESRKRKKKADKSTWGREVSKKHRMMGEAYNGYEYKTDEASGKKTFRTGIARGSKFLGPRCTSKYCEKRKNLRCAEFSDEERQVIMDKFWKTMDWGQKKAYVCSLVDVEPVKKKRGENKIREGTYLYYLKLNESKVQVCRTMFLNTLCVGKFQVLGWIKKSTAGIPAKSPADCHRRGPTRAEAHQAAKRFLDVLPKLPSHYSRSKSTKLYIEPIINSRNELFGVYRSYCQEHSAPSFSRTQFLKIVDNANIGIFLPRKDQCDLCESFRTGQIPIEEYTAHQKRKDLARSEKATDKESSMRGECHVLTMDLQSVKLSPLLKASTMYYKTKLMVHNFTVYNLKSKDAVCYWWHEAEGDLSSSVYASCIRDYISSFLTDDNLPVIIFSDGCTAQNRNVMMSNALLDMSIQGQREICQKFLERGHTQMECDSVHSAIESELKNKPIYIPHDYIKITTDARPGKPYVAKYLKHDFFSDFSMKKIQRINSIRPGSKKGDPCVVDIKQIRYFPNQKIQVKLAYDEAWTDLPHPIKPLLNVDYPKLFHDQRKISTRKFKDLQDLKSVVPIEYHQFYNELPNIN